MMPRAYLFVGTTRARRSTNSTSGRAASHWAAAMISEWFVGVEGVGEVKEDEGEEEDADGEAKRTMMVSSSTGDEEDRCTPARDRPACNRLAVLVAWSENARCLEEEEEEEVEEREGEEEEEEGAEEEYERVTTSTDSKPDVSFTNRLDDSLYSGRNSPTH